MTFILLIIAMLVALTGAWDLMGWIAQRRSNKQ